MQNVRRPSRRERLAFSLIEILIVTAIISILASIAVPNFLEAQIRSKVARVKADCRTVTVAIESYRVDQNAYPYRRNDDASDTYPFPIPDIAKCAQQMSVLTTPVGYMNYLPADIFNINVQSPNNLLDYYDNQQVTWMINNRKSEGRAYFFKPTDVNWLLVSVGPDGYLGPFSDTYSTVATPNGLKGTMYLAYDPTNGTTSRGNIYIGPDGGADKAGLTFMQRWMQQ
jgi:prepilin-type N-terminal cleavage/methylation domain-containing protein